MGVIENLDLRSFGSNAVLSKSPVPEADVGFPKSLIQRGFQMEPLKNVFPFPAVEENATVNRKLVNRWGGNDALFTQGFVGVPVSFLRLYSKLRPYALTIGEAMFVVQLMAFKWNNQAPFPAYTTLADRLGTGDKMARRYAKALEEKGYLKRQKRSGRSNSFDLSPLFEALAKARDEESRFNLTFEPSV